MMYNGSVQTVLATPLDATTTLEVAAMGIVPVRACTVDGCESEQKVKGFCHRHYQRFWAGLSLEPTVIRGDDERRFWSKVEKTDTCWFWRGCLSVHGYGRFAMGKGSVAAHRYSYQLAFGKIPKGEGYHGTCVCHTCDVRNCVNPTHLWLGSNADNSTDKISKGRDVVLRGEASGTARLKEADVLEIRRLYAIGGFTQKELGERFGVSEAGAQKIIARKIWRHI